MQERSALWKELAADSSSRLETVAEIGGVMYTAISSPVINRALMDSALSIGNCMSSTLQFSVLSAVTIPKSAEIVIKMRFSDGTRYSEWLPAGTFYINRRSQDRVNKNLTTITAFDAMRKIDTYYGKHREHSDWPKSMRDVIKEIALKIDLEVDDRTWPYIRDGPDYIIQYPAGQSRHDVLGYIGGVYGGNWCITPKNKLRFVPIWNSTQGSNVSEDETLNVVAITKGISIAQPLQISGIKVIASYPWDNFIIGDESNTLLTFSGNPYITRAIAETLFSQFGNSIYVPYSIENAFYDPATELGDCVISRSDVVSVLYKESAKYGLAFRGNISCPSGEEMDEFPFVTSASETRAEIQNLSETIETKASIDDLTAIQATIDNLSVSDIKTGIIHSNDYQYAPFPLLYPSSTTYPSATTYPSNGEYVLRGFAIDFATGTIYGAFYSEQIYALQEITSEQSEQLLAHIQDYTNPHRVTAAQVGLGNVDNTSDADKPVSAAQQTALDGKVDKVSGKGLSTEDFTTAEKNKLSGIESGAQVNVIDSITVNGAAVSVTSKTAALTSPTKTSDLTNDSGFQTAENVDDKIDAKISGVYRASGRATLATLPALAVANLGCVYDMTQDFTTTSDFVEGAGKTFPAGTNVAIVSVGNAYKYDVLAGVVDLSAIYSRIAALETEVTRLKNSLTYPKS